MNILAIAADWYILLVSSYFPPIDRFSSKAICVFVSSGPSIAMGLENISI